MTSSAPPTEPVAHRTLLRGRFDRRPAFTLVLVFTALTLVLGTATELALRYIGLGNPILYQLNPDYGYRPKPNQAVRRFHGSLVRINNLGVRANSDWDSAAANKVLFLGNSVTYGGSYVSNSDLFSIRAVPWDGWVGGSGGVNAWGVENIHGLIVRHNFLPARIYVTVLIEDDFYRGFAQKPAFFPEARPFLAITEAIPHVLHQLKEWLQPSPDSMDTPDRRATAARAVARLKEIDQHVRNRGYMHLMYLSPYRDNLNGKARPDLVIARLLADADLNVVPLQSRPEIGGLDVATVETLYHDGVHLSRRGHEVWAHVIKRDLETLTSATSIKVP